MSSYSGDFPKGHCDEDSQDMDLFPTLHSVSIGDMLNEYLYSDDVGDDSQIGGEFDVEFDMPVALNSRDILMDKNPWMSGDLSNDFGHFSQDLLTGVELDKEFDVPVTPNTWEILNDKDKSHAEDHLHSNGVGDDSQVLLHVTGREFVDELDLPVAINTREILNDEDKCPWMEDDFELFSNDVGEASQVFLTGVEIDEESDAQHSSWRDPGISSAGSHCHAIASETSPTHDTQPHDGNPVVYFGNKTKNQKEYVKELELKTQLMTEKCMSKNAIAARENRMKKKKYVQELEEKAQLITEKSIGLELTVADYKRRMERAEVEIAYLHNLVANADGLRGLVKYVRGDPSGDKPVALKVLKRHRGEHDGNTRPKKQRIITTAGMSKNAIAARENRIRKKIYVQELEEKVQLLTEKSTDLELVAEDCKHRMDIAEVEVAYLRGIVANVDALKCIVKSVQDGPCGEMLLGSNELKAE